ncbi:MAG: ECF-type sigma factor [Pirellula sp.]|nr:ECF-type sigma factor [Pirellula sp.]
MSTEQGSVTGWISLIREGHQAAFDAFSKRYFSKIRDLAKSRLSKPDSEEVANDVLVALTQSIAGGKYPDLCDRNSLWFLILKITQRRVTALTRRGKVQKRIPAESIEGNQSEDFVDIESLVDYEVELDQVIASKSMEAAWIEISDCWEELLRCLPDEVCRQIAQLKLQSYSNREIAIKMNFTPSKVDRKVRLIQDEWMRIIRLDN